MIFLRRALLITGTYFAVIFFALLFAVFFENHAFAEPRRQANIIFACFPDSGDPYFVEFPQTVVVLHQKIDMVPGHDPDEDDGTDRVGGIIYVDMDGNRHVAYINKHDRCLKLGYKTEI